MALSPLMDANGLPDKTSLLELIIMQASLEWNDQVSMGQLILNIADAGNILAWNFNDNAANPSWAVVRIDGRYVVIITGTANKQQWLRNVLGILAQPYPGSNAKVHGYFQNAWLAIKDGIFAAIGPGIENKHVTYIGHSMGAAVAELGALFHARAYGAASCDHVGFGCPKSLTLGYDGAEPTISNVIAGIQDVVPYLPPNRAIATLGLLSPIFAYTIPQDYWHYEDIFTINDPGVIAVSHAQNYNRNVTTELMNQWDSEHLINVYVRRIINSWWNNIRAGQGRDLIPIAESFLPRAPVQNMAVNIPPAPNINMPFANDELFLQPNNPPLTLDNVANLRPLNFAVNGAAARNLQNIAFTGGDSVANIKGQIFFEEDISGLPTGWVENVWLVTAPDLPTALVDLRAWANSRVQMLGVGVTCSYLRVSDVDITGDSQVDSGIKPLFTTGGLPFYNSDFNTTDDRADFAGTIVLCRAEADAPYRARRQLILSGSPDKIQGINLETPTDAQWLNAFNTWKAIALNGKYGLQTLRTVLNAPKTITNIQNTAPYTITTSVAHGYNVGDMIRLTTYHTSPGIPSPGIYQVGTTPDNTSLTLIGFVSLGNYLSGGTLLGRKLSVVPFKNLVIRRMGNRKRGRPNFLQRGRARKKR